MNKEKQSKKETKNNKKIENDSKKIDIELGGVEPLKFKKRIFNLTSYEDYITDKKEKTSISLTKSHIVQNNSKNFSFPLSNIYIYK